MSDEQAGQPKETKVEVFSSTRMADPAVPDDVVYGKRFTDPATGKAASIADILGNLGVLKPEEKPPES